MNVELILLIYLFEFDNALTKDDVKVYAAVPENPGSSFPNVSKWYECVSSHLAASFPGKGLGVNFCNGVAQADAPAAAESKAAHANDDDDLDLFGDETEEEKKAVEEREAAAKKVTSPKEKESGKSSVLLDIKPWDDKTDVKKL